MGFHLALYFILLLLFLFLFLLCPILQAAEFEEPACGQEVCGNITISSPFGIHSSCYTIPWFRVTCKATRDGQKPFINVNGIDLEVLDFTSADAILISNPVAYINCDHTSEASVSVNLSGTPFFFSSERNNFGSVGCGNLAAILSDEADSLGGCVQPRCDDGASKSGCFTEMTANLTSYTVSMKAMYPDSNRCASAFIYSRDFFRSGYPLPTGINIGTTHAPSVLNWNSTYCGDAGCGRPALGPIEFNTYKVESCGNVSFFYPFGMKHQDNSNHWFNVICNKTVNGQKVPFLNINGTDLQILDFDFFKGTVMVNHPITYFNCRKNHYNGMSLNLIGTRFYYSDSGNIFWSSGCGNLVTVFGNEMDNFISGCLQPSCRINNKASSIVGCRVNVPQGLSSFYVNMSSRVDSSDYKKKRSCGFASMISSDYDLTSEFKDFDISNRTHIPTRLQWGTPISGVCQLNDSSDISCTFDGEYCWSRLSSIHLCACNIGITELRSCKDENCGYYQNCRMLCFNTPSNYCSSESCPPSYEYDSTRFRCERKTKAQKTSNSSLESIIVGCSTSIGTLFLILATWSMYKVLKRKQNIILKKKYFKKLLQQHLPSNEGNVEKLTLFTSKEMEKATDHYNKNRILGQGGQGTVYKGMLIDGSIVAIKKSKMVEGKKFDEKKVEQFINEVIILSQINHRNVVKLLGRCLEAEVPLLVYEFIPNGTLYDLIHNQNEGLPLTWEMRLRIAIEIANALFYLHSAASAPIYHRDIKSSNILLDEKYRAKVSDFGTSRSVALEQTHLTTRVQGTFGYMDPEYFRSSQFTEKSDVYSFGVVLTELLTGQKPISVQQSESVRSLVSYFLHSMQENSLFNILDPMVVKDGSEKEIIVVALLAKRCLHFNGKKRPTMKQVAMELELIKASGGNVIEDRGDEESEIDDMIHLWETNPSSSMSRTITTDSVTFPLNSSF
ncbi:wall-associated receptor kinase-like 6 [Gossypium raimondii]|uniref:wall-associated receptor kinase-like 6 n=1 Tax=Gossypium raimondii TaxID=29730 RepID=UPI00227A1333|nr:wall-associated receptor kinase-like 6 [Gossypium raimondii]